MMMNYKLNRKQRGFFDLGLSLVLLAVFGSTALYLAPDGTSEQAKQTAACEGGQKNKNQEGINCKES